MQQTHFDRLPQSMQNETVNQYIKILDKKWLTLFCKRTFDICVSFVILLIAAIFLLISAIAVKLTSKGPVFFRQVRAGKDGKEFRIFKFRSMVQNADKIGTHITVGDHDSRITKVGYFLRKTRFDEVPQILNILCGHMSLIGPRPEAMRYVDIYTDEMKATLLIRPGITGTASIEFRNENELLSDKENPEQYYIDTILQQKADINLKYIREMTFFGDIAIMFKTLMCLFK